MRFLISEPDVPHARPQRSLGSRRPDEQRDTMVKLRAEVRLILAVWLEVAAAALGRETSSFSSLCRSATQPEFFGPCVCVCVCTGNEN